DARIDIDEAALRVDRVDLAETRHDEHGAARVLRRIAVGAPETTGDDPARARGGDGRDHVLDRTRRDDPGEGRRRTAPSVEQLCIGHRGRGYPAPPTLFLG